jgi:hypothetical protein
MLEACCKGCVVEQFLQKQLSAPRDTQPNSSNISTWRWWLWPKCCALQLPLLLPNTLCPAAAVYDAAGKLLGELGPSTPPVLMALPLPLFYLWGHLLKAAAQLQQWPAARKAAAVLFPRFISSSPARPVWEQHPMDALRLQQPRVVAAAAPLLRLLVQGLFLYASHTGQQLQEELSAADVASTKLEGAAAAGSGSRQLLRVLQQPRLDAQLQLLRSGKRLLLGMQVSSQYALIWTIFSACSMSTSNSGSDKPVDTVM